MATKIPTLAFMYHAAVQEARHFIERPRPIFTRAGVLAACKEMRNQMIADAALTMEQRIARDAELRAARLKHWNSLTPRQQYAEMHND
jgi:hypothetical protein